MKLLSLNIVECSVRLTAQRNFGVGIGGGLGSFSYCIISPGADVFPYPMGFKAFKYDLRLKERTFYQNLPIQTLRAALPFKVPRKA